MSWPGSLDGHPLRTSRLARIGGPTVSKISTPINHGIILGTSGNYTSPLTITATGAVYASSGNAVYGPNIAAWTVANQGRIAASGSNGDGVLLMAGGLVDNSN